MNRISTDQNVLTVIGDKHITHRSEIISEILLKLSINGPFYCYITWIDSVQSIDIYTDSNLHRYIFVKIENDTLKIMIKSDGNFKITQMDVYLNLYPTIENIYVAGISTLESRNLFVTNKLLKLRTEDTSSLLLSLDVFNLNTLFLSAGSTKLIGNVKNTTSINYYGIGDIDASELFSNIVNVHANGLGTVWITSNDRCQIKAEGVSIVRYNCPQINHTDLTGLAKIIPFEKSILS